MPRTHDAALRCDGSGHCVPRARAASPFRCEGDRCVQHQPRLPDDGEWECTDLAGAVVCRGGIAPAGVSTGAPDVGWVCGQRPDGGGFGAAICVDLAPDLPDVAATARDPDGRSRWECRYTYTALHAERVCVPRAGRTGFVGDACNAGRPCLQSARCIDARCVPPRPAPACWLDGDCAGGRTCSFGTCTP